MNNIQAMQNQARSDYERYYADDLVSEAPARYGALQAVMLAEIALQLAGINEKLNTITEHGGSAELLCSTLSTISDILDK